MALPWLPSWPCHMGGTGAGAASTPSAETHVVFPCCTLNGGGRLLRMLHGGIAEAFGKQAEGGIRTLGVPSGKPTRCSPHARRPETQHLRTLFRAVAGGMGDARGPV
eukprot:366449-Chlamydomonas_euryale.AAC.13